LADTHGIEKYARTYIRDAHTHAHTHTPKTEVERLGKKKVGKPQKSKRGDQERKKEEKKEKDEKKRKEKKGKMRERWGENIIIHRPSSKRD